MHINTELIECCYLTSAMLLEIPYMAGNNGQLTVMVQFITACNLRYILTVFGCFQLMNLTIVEDL